MEGDKPKQPEPTPGMTVEQAELLVFSASYGLVKVGPHSNAITRTVFLPEENMEIIVNEKGLRLKTALKMLFPSLILYNGGGHLSVDGLYDTFKNFSITSDAFFRPHYNKLLAIHERLWGKLGAGETSRIDFSDTIIKANPVVNKHPFTDGHRTQLAELIEDLRQKETTAGPTKTLSMLYKKLFEHLTQNKDAAYKEANPLTDAERNKIRKAYKKAKDKMDLAGLDQRQDQETTEAQGVVNREPKDIGAGVLFSTLVQLYEERAKRPPAQARPTSSVIGARVAEAKMVDHPNIKRMVQDMSEDEAELILYRLTAKRFEEAKGDTITLLPDKHVLRLDHPDGLKVLAALLRKFPDKANILRLYEKTETNAGGLVQIIKNIPAMDFLEVFRSLKDIYEKLKHREANQVPFRCVVTLEELYNEKPGHEVNLQAPSLQEFPAAVRERFLDVIKRELTHGREKALDLLYGFVAVMIGAKGLKKSEKKILYEAYDAARPKDIIDRDLPITEKLEEIAKNRSEILNNGQPKLEAAINQIKLRRENAQYRKGGDGGKGTGGQPPGNSPF